MFTNLGRDHLDFHGTMERYFAAKAALFTPDLTDRAVVNVDDLRGRLLVDVATDPRRRRTRSPTSDEIDVDADVGALPLARARGARARSAAGST